MRRKGKSREGRDILDEISDEHQQRSREEFNGKAAEQEWNDPLVFARNLGILIQMKGRTLKSTADEVGADYQWIRRIATRGMVRITDDNHPYLKKLAKLFEIGRIEDLWMPDLIVVRQERPTVTDHLLPGVVAPYARKLILLLASGEHDYLREMIDTLHGMLKDDDDDEPSSPTPSAK
jgi:hypothetical protein